MSCVPPPRESAVSFVIVKMNEEELKGLHAYECALKDRALGIGP